MPKNPLLEQVTAEIGEILAEMAGSGPDHTDALRSIRTLADVALGYDDAELIHKHLRMIVEIVNKALLKRAN